MVDLQWRFRLCPALSAGCLALGLSLAPAARAEPSLGADRVCQASAISPLFDGGQPTLLVVLSPRMPYALREWARMESVAERAGFRVQAMRDPRVSSLEWQQALASVELDDRLQGIPLVDEQFAAMCGLLNHSPAALAGRCGSVHPWPILGVMPDESLSRVLRSRLDALSEGECP